jgi:hypothetical protein
METSRCALDAGVASALLSDWGWWEDEVGLHKLNAVLTHSLKAPGFNP